MNIKSFFLNRVESSAIIGCIIVVLFFSIGTEGVWLNGLPNVLRVVAMVGILAIGQALLMTSGEIDLSVGSVFAFTAIIFINVMEFGFGVIPSIVVAVFVASLIGLINGTITVKLKVPSMVVTLGSMFVFRGVVYILTEGYSLSIPRSMRNNDLIELIGSRSFDLNNTFYIMIVLMLFFAFILGWTKLGSHIFAVGGEPESARANGVSPEKIKTISFMICSALAGLAGILIVCQEGEIYSTSGKLLELETIAAAVIGGCTLRGGIGSIWGAVLGVFMFSSLKGGLMLMGAPSSWYIALVGAILIIFLVLSELMKKLKKNSGQIVLLDKKI